MAHSAASIILDLLHQRAQGKTICPSEAARALANSNDRAAWEPKMPTIRRAAQKLIEESKIVATQKGQPIQLETARGPIRLRLL